jgi:hypothetical protein
MARRSACSNADAVKQRWVETKKASPPYSKDRLGDDFRDVREAFDKTDKRQLAGMPAVRRDQSNKMAKTVSATNRPRKTYNPVNVASGRHRLDQARAKGAVLMEQKPDESVTSPAFVTLLGLMKLAKPLKQWRERRGSNPRPPA